MGGFRPGLGYGNLVMVVFVWSVVVWMFTVCDVM